MTDEKFKAWYHGALAGVSLAEAFTAKTTLRKVMLVLAAGWHARCVMEHLGDLKQEPLTFPNKPLRPRKTVVFNDEECKVTEDELRQGVPKPEGQTEALPKETTEGRPQLQTGRFVSLVSGKPRRRYRRRHPQT